MGENNMKFIVGMDLFKGGLSYVGENQSLKNEESTCRYGEFRREV